MKTIKAPCAARAPTRLGRVERRERKSRYFEAVLNFFCERVRASEHSLRGPFRILERRHGLAEIVERGGGVSAERLRVHRPHLERNVMILSKNASRHGDRFAQQHLGFFEAP